MSTTATMREPSYDRFGSGLAFAILLHVLVAGGIVAAALLGRFHKDRWGESASTEGAVQASMVDAIPLPQKAPPVDKSVLVSPDVSPAPATPPKEAATTAPKPTDVLVKGKPVTKTAPAETPAPPKHPQPTPVTPKAASADAATLIPQAIAQNKNGTAALTVKDRVFGERYAWYIEAMQRKINQNWYTQEADPRASQGKSVKLIFDIAPDGSPANIRVEVPSGSPSLDTSALRALQRVDSFGPLPTGNQKTVEDIFTYVPQQ